MVCVHYEKINKATGAVIIKNFGWFSSVDAAKKELGRNPRIAVRITGVSK